MLSGFSFLSACIAVALGRLHHHYTTTSSLYLSTRRVYATTRPHYRAPHPNTTTIPISPNPSLWWLNHYTFPQCASRQSHLHPQPIAFAFGPDPFVARASFTLGVSKTDFLRVVAGEGVEVHWRAHDNCMALVWRQVLLRFYEKWEYESCILLAACNGSLD
jgi:hypothetical protein